MLATTHDFFFLMLINLNLHQTCNSPYRQTYISYNVSSENLVLDQLIIPKLLFFFILIIYLVNIVLIYVRRNSVLVTRGS